MPTSNLGTTPSATATGNTRTACGAFQLEEILDTFLTWARSMRPDWLATPSDQVIAARDDRDYRAALGDEVGPERCRHAGCDRKRIRHSVLCRLHHYEQIKGRPYPRDN